MIGEEREAPSEGAVREQLREEPGPRGSSAPAAGEDAHEDAESAPEVDSEAAADAEEPAEELDPLAAAERDRDEYLALAQRTQADFENYRRRAARDAAAAGQRAKGGLVRELLPALDNLERALAAAGDADEGLVGGVRMVHAELVAALERSGVAAFEPSGERFDPTVHEALSTQPADGAEPGVVLEVIEKGYRLDDTVLRPARVVVSA